MAAVGGRLASSAPSPSPDRSGALRAPGDRRRSSAKPMLPGRVDQVGVEEVAEQLDAVDQARPGPGEGRGGVDREDPRGAERGDLLPVLQRLRVGVARRTSRRASRSTTSGSRPASAPQPTSGDFRPGGPATSSPPAIEIISGIQWPPTKGGSSHSSAITRGLAGAGDRGADGRQPALELAAQLVAPAARSRSPRRAGSRLRASRRACSGPAGGPAACSGSRAATSTTSS